MRLPRLFSTVCLLGLSSLAHADTLQQFNATNINFYTGPNMPATTGSLAGGIVVDTTTGLVTSSTLQYNAVGGGTYNFFGVPAQGMIGVTYLLTFSGSNGSQLGLFVPGNLVNYMGSQVCYYPSQASCTQPSIAGGATASQSSYVSTSASTNALSAYSGSFTPGSLVTATTPEPSSLLLLSTGVGCRGHGSPQGVACRNGAVAYGAKASLLAAPRDERCQ